MGFTKILFSVSFLESLRHSAEVLVAYRLNLGLEKVGYKWHVDVKSVVKVPPPETTWATPTTKPGGFGNPTWSKWKLSWMARPNL